MKKYKKTLLIIFSSLLIIFLVVIIYFVFFFEMFPVHKEELAKIVIPNKNYSIVAYYVDSGASSNWTVQINKVYDSGKFDILKNIEGYKEVKDLQLLCNNKIKVIVGTKSKFSTKCDTIIINLIK